jgi:hypothetical protein
MVFSKLSTRVFAKWQSSGFIAAAILLKGMLPSASFSIGYG